MKHQMETRSVIIFHDVQTGDDLFDDQNSQIISFGIWTLTRRFLYMNF